MGAVTAGEKAAEGGEPRVAAAAPVALELAAANRWLGVNRPNGAVDADSGGDASTARRGGGGGAGGPDTGRALPAVGTDDTTAGDSNKPVAWFQRRTSISTCSCWLDLCSIVQGGEKAVRSDGGKGKWGR